MTRHPGNNNLLSLGVVEKLIYLLYSRGWIRDQERIKSKQDIMKQWALGFLFLSPFFTSHHAPFHQVLITGSGLSAVLFLSLINVCLWSPWFCLFYSFVSSLWLLYFSFFFLCYYFPSSGSFFFFHCTLSQSKMVYWVWTMNELILNELMTVLSQSISHITAHWVSIISDSNQN